MTEKRRISSLSDKKQSLSCYAKAANREPLRSRSCWWKTRTNVSLDDELVCAKQRKEKVDTNAMVSDMDCSGPLDSERAGRSGDWDVLSASGSSTSATDVVTEGVATSVRSTVDDFAEECCPSVSFEVRPCRGAGRTTSETY